MNSNGIISAPVNSDDIVAVVKVNSHNWEDQCRSLNINGWAKYKPVEINQPGTITDAQRKQIGWGLAIPSYTNAVTMAQAVYALTSDDVEAKIDSTFFRYTRPTTCMRIDDFVGYNQNCKRPAEPISQNSITMPATGNTASIGMMFALVSGITNNITIHDLVSDPSLYYLGIAITNGSNVWGVTQQYPINNTSGQVPGQVDVAFGTVLAVGSYLVFAFLSPQKIDSFALIGSKTGTFIPLSFTRKTIAFTRAEKKLFLSCTAYKSTTNTKQIQFSYTIKNTGGVTADIRKVVLVAYNNSGTSLATTQYSDTYYLGADQSKTQTGLLTCQSVAMRDSVSYVKMTVTEVSKEWTITSYLQSGPSPD